jgi:hypothetical protein
MTEQPAYDLKGFQTEFEGIYARPHCEVPALVFNPEATPIALVSAAHARAATLHKLLDCWARVETSEISVLEIASALEPMAQEVELLLERLSNCLPTS